MRTLCYVLFVAVFLLGGKPGIDRPLDDAVLARLNSFPLREGVTRAQFEKKQEGLTESGDLAFLAGLPLVRESGTQAVLRAQNGVSTVSI